MEVILVFLLAMSLSIGYFYLKKNRNIKSSVVKKEEIIEMYKEQMTKVIRDNQNNTKVQREEKTKLLKKINNELSMNLFFDEQESKKVIQDLLKIN